MTSAFISHSSCDKKFVRRLAMDLRASGIKAWLDEAEIKIGEPLTHRIQDAISNHKFFIAIISKNSLSSEWVSKEIEIALELEIKSHSVKILPVIIDDCSPPSFVNERLCADIRKEENYFTEFVKIVNSIDPTPKVKLSNKNEYPQLRNSLQSANYVIQHGDTKIFSFPDIALDLFTLLDGGYVFLSSAEEAIPFAVFISAFADHYPDFFYLIRNVALYDDSTDRVAQTAIIALALAKSNIGRTIWMETLSNPELDIYDLTDGISDLVAYTRIEFDSIPGNFLDIANSSRTEEQRADRDRFLRWSVPEKIPLTPELNPLWENLLAEEVITENPVYRSTIKGLRHAIKYKRMLQAYRILKDARP